jgi:hypothetical protein
MNPQELSTYLTYLLRSEPEVIASFFMGVFFAGMLTLTVRRWASPGRDSDIELTKKDAEIARKDTEVARKDVQIARVEAMLANQRETMLELERLVTSLRHQNATFVAALPIEHKLLVQLAAAEACRVGLEAENRQLVEDKHSLEDVAANLRTDQAQAVDELAHWAKWSRRFDEENARLVANGALSEG